MHYDNNKPRYVRYAIYALVLVAVSLLQNSRGALPELFGAKAMLVLPCCMGIAMHERELSAAAFGAFGGLLLDVCGATDGFNTLLLMVLSVVCSLLISRIMQNNIVTALVLNAGALVIYFALYAIINILLNRAGITLRLIGGFYLPSLLYSMVFVPPFYALSKRVYTSHKTTDE